MLGAALSVLGCSSDAVAPGPEARVDATRPVALLAEPDGSLLYAERLTGDVRRLLPTGTVDPDVVAHVDVIGADTDQRGLVGLTRSPDGTLVGAWVRPDDGRLVVGTLDDRAPRLIWIGPQSSDLADGGHLATDPDGRIVIGIGDLQQDPALADVPTVPNRKLLALDPLGAPDQLPQVLSTGWNNPFAFTFATDGVLWVADNTPGDRPERIGRGDRPAAEATDLDTADDGEAAPSALVAIGPGRLGRCGYLAGRLDEVEVDAATGEARLTGTTLANACSTGAAVLTDGRIVTADEVGLSIFARP